MELFYIRVNRRIVILSYLDAYIEIVILSIKFLTGTFLKKHPAKNLNNVRHYQNLFIINGSNYNRLISKFSLALSIFECEYKKLDP